MAKYLFHGSYSERGLQGLLKEGGSGRQAAIEQLMKGLGGRLEVVYWAFGGDDFYVIADLPDNESAAAGSLVVSATGTSQVATTVLLTAEQLDEATKKTVNFRPPGK